jgi:hypothetical protein
MEEIPKRLDRLIEQKRANIMEQAVLGDRLRNARRVSND